MLKEARVKAIPASCLLIDSRFASPKLFKMVPGLKLHAIGRLKDIKTVFRIRTSVYTVRALRCYAAYRLPSSQTLPGGQACQGAYHRHFSPCGCDNGALRSADQKPF